MSYSIVWPADRWEALTSLAAGKPPPPDIDPIEASLAPAMMAAALGDRSTAIEVTLSTIDQADHSGIDRDAFFLPIFVALFAIERLDLAADWFCRRHRIDGAVEFAIDHPGPGPHIVQWSVLDRSRMRFAFSPSLLTQDDTRLRLLQFHWLVPLLADYMRGGGEERGCVNISLWDAGLAPGLAFCSNRPDCILVPDNLFVSTRGYEDLRRSYAQHPVAWAQRRPVAFWRGTTTGRPQDPARGWKSLPRIQLCELARDHADLLDAGIAAIVQIDDPTAGEWLEREGLLREYASPQSFNRYRYQIDIDGNTNSWPGLFQKLLTGSPVLKVASADGYRQWYYDRLLPWENYVPVAADLSDLVDKIRWLRTNDHRALAIGERGRALALSLDYETELKRARPVLSAALRSAGR